MQPAMSPTPKRRLVERPPVSALYKSYYAVRFARPVWTHVMNRSARRVRAQTSAQLPEAAMKAIETLRRDGIVRMKVHDLLPGFDFEGARAFAESVLQEDRVQRKIKDAEAKLSSPQGAKHYNVRMWENASLDLSNPYLQLLLDETLLRVAAEYLEVAPRLRYADLWYNLPMGGADIMSQRWHRDPEDRRLLKVFLHVRDVDDTMGPLNYVRGSHDGGEHTGAFPRVPPYGSYPPEGAVERAIPAGDLVRCTGPAGTLALCDTAGLHKGGHSHSRPRFLLNAMYATDGALPMARQMQNFRFVERPADKLTRLQRHAAS